MRKIFIEKELRDRALFVIAVLAMLANFGCLAVAIAGFVVV